MISTFLNSIAIIILGLSTIIYIFIADKKYQKLCKRLNNTNKEIDILSDEVLKTVENMNNVINILREKIDSL